MFPTNSTALGNAEIIFNANLHPSSGNITSLDRVTTTADGMHLAYIYTTVDSSHILEIKDTRTNRAVVLSEVWS